MPIQIDLVDEGAGVYLNAEGTLNGEELYRGLIDFLADHQGKFVNLHFLYANFEDCVMADVEDHWIENVARLTSELARFRPGVQAAIATGDELAFGIARMWQNLSGLSDWNVLVCRSSADAKSWLSSRLGFIPEPLRT